MFMCGQVVHNKHRLDLHHFNESQWLISNKLKGFHMAVSAWTFREGVEKMLQQNGLGAVLQLILFQELLLSLSFINFKVLINH